MQRYIYRLLCLCFLLGSFNAVWAIDEKYAAPELRGNQLAPDSTSMVMDAVYFDPSLKPLQTTWFVKNLITFQIDESYRQVLPDEFNVSMRFKIHYTTDNNGTPVTGETEEITLGVEYSKYTNYKNKEVYIGNNWYKVTIEIISVTGSGNLNDYRDALMLTNEILINREYNFSCTNNTIQQLFTNNATVATKGELNVYWLPERAADEYDLEWTYIDELAIDNYKIGNGFDAKKIFRNNNTRVSINKETYNIPLLFEASGRLFYRVRAVQVRHDGQRLESAWSSDYNNGLGTYAFAGLDTALNWQAATNFAEDGKRKSIVQYYDGALKNRQSVTKDNSTDTAVIDETFYDYQGRPVIQVMPTPSLSSIIQFTPGFNRLNGAEYRKDEYDGVLQGENYCKEGAPVMDTFFGAANYYSPKNPLATRSFHKYIPNAKGYVFAETRYTPDNTGLVSMRGGVGEEFHIGKGHEIGFTYNNADQEELDALFGTEAGNASHYEKNTVRDANGQVKVTYLDMQGRTIATALAGMPPGVDPLPSNNPYYITKKLLDSNSNLIKGMALESSKALVVTKAGANRFIYSLLPDSISIQDCNNNTICYDCIYDLTVTITDECNNSTFTNKQPVVITRSNYQINVNCDPINVFPAIDTTVYLMEGSYLVTKTLTVNKQAMDYYRDSIFMVRNTCRTLEQTIQEQKTLLATAIQCTPSCATCSTSLGDWDTYRNSYMQQAGIANSDSVNYRIPAYNAYVAEQEECKKICDGVVVLQQTLREKMLLDVTPPYGQYANPTAVDYGSIFWKLDLYNENYKTINGNYHDENGQAENPDPRYLEQPAFIDAFKSSWAESLLQTHPEYLKLKKYEELEASYTWDQQFANTETYQQAIDRGYLNAGDFATHPAGANFTHNPAYRDPFFTLYVDEGKVDTYKKDQMQASLLDQVRDANNNPVSMWSLATILANCPTSEANCVNDYKSLNSAFSIGAHCTGDRDMAWRYFRELYLNRKRELVAQILREAQQGSLVFSDLSPLVNAGHTLTFYDPVLTPPAGMPTNEQAARDSLQSYINANCAAYVQQWWEDLKPCGYDSSDSLWIIPKLIQVCKEGGDESHLFGASTTKPSSTYQYKSFEEVMKAYSAVSGKPYNATCNVYLISAPVPYDQQPVYNNKPVYQKPDNCECEKITSLYNQFVSAGGSGTFANYLYTTTGTVVSQGALDTLRMACAGQVNCTYLSSPIYLPPVLQCGVTDVCIDCKKFDTLYKAYVAQFPDARPAVDNNDSLQIEKNKLFERFMNKQLGFGKTTGEYLDFKAHCGINETKCDTLQDILRGYTEVRLNDSSRFLRNQIVPNNQFTYTVSDIYKNGYAHIPDQYINTTNYGSHYRKYDTLCVGEVFTFATRVKKPARDINLTELTVQVHFLDNGGFNNVAPIFCLLGQNPTAADTAYVLANSGRIGYIDYKPPINHILSDYSDWVEVKIVRSADSIWRVYYDGVFVNERYIPKRVDKIVGFQVIFQGRANNGYIDYLKVYDQNNKLQYVEEFEDARQSPSNDPEAFRCTDSCQNKFTRYYNKVTNSSLTYAQIQEVYSSCGTPLDGCSYVNSCDTLTRWLEAYKSYGGIPHLDASGADTTHWKANFGGWNYTIGVPLAEVIKDGTMKLPAYYADTLNRSGVGFDYLNDTICIDSAGFTWETRIKLPDNLISQNIYGASWWLWLYTDSTGGSGDMLMAISPIDGKGVAVCTHSNDSKKSCADIDAPGQHLNDWRVVKFQFQGRSFKYFIDDQLMATRVLDAPFTKLYKWSFSPFSKYGEIDYVKIYEADGTMLYEENFDDAHSLAAPKGRCGSCETDFAAFYNQKNGSSLSYQQIAATYASTCGNTLNPCMNRETTDLEKIRNEFSNDYFNHGRRYDSNGCDTTSFKVDWGGWYNNTGVAHKDIFKNGIMQFPDTLRVSSHRGVTYDFYVHGAPHDSACIDNYLNMEFRMKDTLLPTETDHGQIFTLYFGPEVANQIIMAVNPLAPVWNYLYVGDRSGRDVTFYGNTEFIQNYNGWHTINIEFKDTIFNYAVDGQIVKTLHYPSFDHRKFYGYSITTKGDGNLGAAFDYIKFYDRNGKPFYYEQFDNCGKFNMFEPYIQCPRPSCKEAFTTYYNKKKQTAYTYEQLKSLYAAHNLVLSMCDTTLSDKLCGKTEPVFAPDTWKDRTNCADSTLFATSTGVLIHEAYRDSLQGSFNDRYLAKCLSARYNENFTVYQQISEYHYTLYYYDQAGNLLKTVAPQGVDVSKFAWARAWSDSVTIARRNRQELTPNHSMPTQYRYNTLDDVVAQHSPDGGLSEFWYDRLGRIAISSNAKQKAAANPVNTEEKRMYTYTRYDQLGRVTEVGQISNTSVNSSMNDGISRDQGSLDNWLLALNNRRGQITSTIYDLPYTGFQGIGDPRKVISQRNLRNRISYITLTDTGSTTAYNQATFYTYDILGNTDQLLQDYGSSGFTGTANIMNKNENRWKKIGYQYDLISGKVNMVMYQQGWQDGFFHRYSYDAENRLTLVETSRDSLVWEKDARYEFYRHGPLARITLGEQQVQGIDYAYTLQGWLKGINSTAGNIVQDMGGDGKVAGLNQFTATDAIGVTLNYFGNDYAPINTTSPAGVAGGGPFPGYSGHLPGNEYKPLYNGNITSSSVYHKKFDYANSPGGPLIFYNYRYDQLNRLTGQDAYNGFGTVAANSWQGMQTMGERLKERVAYDGNGNILKYLRNSLTGSANFQMDSLNYHYYANTNRLRRVTDNVPANGYVHPNDYIRDVDGQQDNNYGYDAIGNLVRDDAENITSIKWNVYGKIQEINKTATAQLPVSSVRYGYDVAGNRISQEVTSGGTKYYTWFVRDGEGNILSTYSAEGNETNLTNLNLYQTERYLYGSLRLGVLKNRDLVDDDGPESTDGYYGNQSFDRGVKEYELTNHLGNVLATISDRKFGIGLGTSSFVDHYDPHILVAQDYYPFGMLSRIELPSSGATYRFGFNGKMNDNEVKWLGNQQDYGMRIYDPRLGRFLSVDPLTGDYPDLTPYQFASNRPIDGVDLDGLEYSRAELSDILSRAKAALGKMATTNAIVLRGASNAIVNANLLGIPDNLPWGTDNVDDYSTDYDKSLYLWGRVIGDVASALQGLTEMAGGSAAAGGGAAVSGTGVGAIVGLPTALVGLLVAGHGTGTTGAAAVDLGQTLAQLRTMGAFSTGAGDAAENADKTPEQNTDNQNDAAHNNKDQKKSDNSNNKNNNNNNSNTNNTTEPKVSESDRKLREAAQQSIDKKNQKLERKQKRQKQSQQGNMGGNSNQDVRGSHHTNKRGKNHDGSIPRRLRDQKNPTQSKKAGQREQQKRKQDKKNGKK